jgi:hypothetical protein
LSELAGGRLITTTVGITTTSLWPASERPKSITLRGTIDDWLVTIASGGGFGVSVASTAVLHPHPQVRYVPVRDASPVPVLLATPRRAPHPSCGLLRQVAEATRFGTRTGSVF